MNQQFGHDDARFNELLQRWSSGDFTRADERELFALARDDEFRREALEGFMSQPEAAHDKQLAALSDKIGRPEGAKRRALPIQIMMAVAAGMLLLVAALVFFPTLNKNAQPEAVATQMEPSPVQTPETRPQAQRDAAPPPAAVPRAPLQAPSNTVLDAGSAAGRTAAATQPAATAADKLVVAEDAEAKTAAAEDALAQTRARMEQRVQAAKPAPPASKDDMAVQSESRDQSAPAGRPGASAKKVDEEADRAMPKSAKAKAATQPDPQKSIEAYVLRRARLTKAARDNNVSGNVRVRFRIGADGKATDLELTRKLGYGCDEEAERLIREFSFEPSAAGQTMEIEVPFVR